MAVLRTGTKIDLVLTDIQLQGTLDGIGLARFVRSNLPRPGRREAAVSRISGKRDCLDRTQKHNPARSHSRSCCAGERELWACNA
jgi:hypothetical protein